MTVKLRFFLKILTILFCLSNCQRHSHSSSKAKEGRDFHFLFGQNLGGELHITTFTKCLQGRDPPMRTVFLSTHPQAPPRINPLTRPTQVQPAGSRMFLIPAPSACSGVTVHAVPAPHRHQRPERRRPLRAAERDGPLADDTGGAAGPSPPPPPHGIAQKQHQS